MIYYVLYMYIYIVCIKYKVYFGLRRWNWQTIPRIWKFLRIIPTRNPNRQSF